jgi:hypothetical protein
MCLCLQHEILKKNMNELCKLEKKISIKIYAVVYIKHTYTDEDPLDNIRR